MTKPAANRAARLPARRLLALAGFLVVSMLSFLAGRGELPLDIALLSLAVLFLLGLLIHVRGKGKRKD